MAAASLTGPRDAPTTGGTPPPPPAAEGPAHDAPPAATPPMVLPVARWLSRCSSACARGEGHGLASTGGAVGGA
eukprot:5688551-Prymnesium_polylepis.1